MAGAKEIKNRINSIKDTRKITNAMYLIASVKMKKAKEDLDHTRPYFDALREEIKRIFRTAQDIDSRFFYPVGAKEPENGTYGCLVITGDKGLAGAYNHTVIKTAEEFYKKHPDTVFFTVGEYGRQHFIRHKMPIDREFRFSSQNPTMYRAREISAALLSRFEEQKLDKIYVIYTDLKNGMMSRCVTTRLLPFDREQFSKLMEEDSSFSPFEFTPSLTAVLDGVMPSYLSGFIYGALVDSFCSEQSARMAAMKSADDNADKILFRLSTEYNRVRQAAITREITEVSSGAMAQKKNRR